MDENLISKKELLEITGISYGALYRYKRKNLIPDEWFIRKSTFTGQETFFPRDLILQRIEQIQSLKEEASLDDMAPLLSGDIPHDLRLPCQQIMDSLSPPLREIATEMGMDETLGFMQIAALKTADSSMRSGAVGLDEAKKILELMLSCTEPKPQDKLLCYRQSGVFFPILLLSGEVYTGHGLKAVFEAGLNEITAEIKQLIKSGG